MNDEAQNTEQKPKQNLDEGYYQEAYEWFREVYISPRVEMTRMKILAGVMCFSTFIYFIAFTAIFPLSPNVAFTIERPHNQSEFVSIKPIRYKDATPTEGYVKYMLSEFTRSWEGYQEDKTDRNFYFIAQIAGDETFAKYEQLYDINLNPDHPLLIYGQRARKQIGIGRIEIPSLPEDLDESTTPVNAKVYFRSFLIFEDNSQQVENHVAEVRFSYKRIVVDQRTHEISQKPEILILDYKSKTL